MSSRGHRLLRLLAPALCAAALFLAPGRACGQFHLFEFGAGTDYLSELQKSLTISSSLGTVTIHDLDDGTTVTTPLDGDPRLLNRKFDIEWSMNGPGVQIPISFSLGPSWGQVKSSLVAQIREGDFDLRFLNQREPGVDDSLHGRGTFYGAEIAVATHVRNYVAESGYRFQRLAGADAERSPVFASPGLRVLGDESRLSRETHDSFIRFGYSHSGKDIVTYTGVRHRRADVEIEDELRLLDPQLNLETAMRSRTKLDGSATEAIAGVEGQRRFRGRTVLGRAEFTFSDRDYGVVAAVIYKRSNHFSPDEQLEKKLDKIAIKIAPSLARIAARFSQERERLKRIEASGAPPAFLLTESADLLVRTESELLDVLNQYPVLGALADWVTESFRQAKRDLQLLRPSNARIALASFEQGPKDTSTSLLDTILAPIQTVCFLIKSIAEKREFDMKLTFEVDFGAGATPSVSLQINPPYNPNKGLIKTLAPGQTATVPRGLYSFLLYEDLASQIVIRGCDVARLTPRDPPCPLDLVKDPLPVFSCAIIAVSEEEITAAKEIIFTIAGEAVTVRYSSRGGGGCRHY